MKEGKDNVKPKGDIAEAAPEEISVAVSRVQSESDAIEVIKKHRELNLYKGELLVTEDRCVFIQSNESKALNHASKQRLKLFRIQWTV